MNDTNRKQLGGPAYETLSQIIRCVDDPKGMKISTRVHGMAVRDLAKWDAKAVKEGWPNAREWVAAGPSCGMADDAKALINALSDEQKAMLRANMQALAAAGIRGSR